MQGIVQAVYHSTARLLSRPHFHDCHQIILIVNGQAEVCINGASYRAGRGDIVLFSRHENHSIRVCSKEYERYVLHVDPSIVNQRSPVYSILTDRPVGFCNVIRIAPYMEDMIGIFKHLVSEHEGALALGEEMEQLLVRQLLITIFRCAALRGGIPYDSVVAEVKRRFENSYGEPYTLSQLAKQYNLSISALSHRFRAVTGMPVMEYLLSCRMASAKRMLAGTDTSIGEIVEACGFSDNSNFARTFKRLNGMSPSDFRKTYKAE